MKVRNLCLLLAGAAASVLPGVSSASVVNFDFSTLNGGFPSVLASPQTVNGVKATGFADGTAASVVAPLFINSAVGDRGLGVCGQVGVDCAINGGDSFEMDNQVVPESILLENLLGGTWISLWVSSLDSNNNSATVEKGKLYWGNTVGAWAGSFDYGFGSFGGAVEGDILTLGAAAAFNPAAKYVLFTPDYTNGQNNDHMVWKGTIDAPVPEPASLGLLGLGLLGVGYARRRNR